MLTLMRIGVVVAIVTAAHTTWAGQPASRACCLGVTCQILSHGDCESAGGDIQAAPSCSPDPCIGCCRSGNPTSCENNVVERDCVTRPGYLQFRAPAVCGDEGQCVTIATQAPALTPRALAIAAAVLFGGGLFVLRRRT